MLVRVLFGVLCILATSSLSRSAVAQVRWRFEDGSVLHESVDWDRLPGYPVLLEYVHFGEPLRPGVVIETCDCRSGLPATAHDVLLEFSERMGYSCHTAGAGIDDAVVVNCSDHGLWELSTLRHTDGCRAVLALRLLPSDAESAELAAAVRRGVAPDRDGPLLPNGGAFATSSWSWTLPSDCCLFVSLGMEGSAIASARLPGGSPAVVELHADDPAQLSDYADSTRAAWHVVPLTRRYPWCWTTDWTMASPSTTPEEGESLFAGLSPAEGACVAPSNATWLGAAIASLLAVTIAAWFLWGRARTRTLSQNRPTLKPSQRDGSGKF